MKKQAFALIVSSLALLGCQKGSVKGQVLDAFTKQPVQNAKVQVLGTPFSASVGADGKFEFKELDIGLAKVSTGKNKFSKSLVEVELTEKNANADLKLYIFSKKDMAPGLFSASPEGAQKIRNEWVGMDALCKDDIVAFKLEDTIEKTGKKVTLDKAALTSQDMDLYFYQKGSNKSPITAIVTPVNVRSAEKYADKCTSIGKNKKLLVADLSKGTQAETRYVSDNLFGIQGKLSDKRQLVTFKQSGKILGSYLLKGQ